MSEVYVKEPNTSGKAILRTTHGDLEVEMWATECPKACRNFCQLILEGYYNGTIFHRVIKDFIIQGGDGTNTGDGSESIYGKPYPDEIHPRLKFRYRGMMGIASAGKNTNTNGSQFFIALDRAPSLDTKHTLFAKVVGQTVYNLVRLSEVPVDKVDRPLDPPRIIRAELVWDPFGDLEPRRQPSPPRLALKAPEVHRRAPVQNKRKLSFAASEDDGGSDEEEERAPAVVPKGKSAHDLLHDPKLLKETAYPEQAQQQSRQPGDKKRPAAEQRQSASAEPVMDAKRRATANQASASKKSASNLISKVNLSESGSEDDDSDDSSGGGGGHDDIAKLKSNKRKEAINQLKREIAGVGVVDDKQKGNAKKRASLLEELRAGYKPRGERASAKPQGKEGRKQHAAEVEDSLRSFRNRLDMAVGQAEALEKAAQEEKKKDKKEKKDKKDKKEGDAGKERDTSEKKEEKAEIGTFASIWDEGDEEGDEDWLSGGGLRFHVSADKAFQLDRDRAKETLEVFDPLLHKGNAEVLADTRKKAASRLEYQRKKPPPRPRGDDDRDGRDRKSRR